MTTPSKTLNSEQEKLLVTYSSYRARPVNDVVSFFKEKWKDQTEKEAEQHLNSAWERDGQKYRCEVYGSIKNFYFAPWILGSEKADIELGRSTSVSNDRFLLPAGDLLFVYLILEYQGLVKRSPYELHYMAYFDADTMPRNPDGTFPLVLRETWEQ